MQSILIENNGFRYRLMWLSGGQIAFEVRPDDTQGWRDATDAERIIAARILQAGLMTIE